MSTALRFLTLCRSNHIRRTGNRRLRPPEPIDPYVGTHYVQEFGKSCPQQALTLPIGLNSRLVEDIGSVMNGLYEDITPSHEDCKEYIVLSIAMT